MRYSAFQIQNYKGVNNACLELDKIPKLNIFTLIGLNESGKTTILDAINHFLNPCLDPNDLIPKSKRANLNGDITIEAALETEPTDEDKIKDFLSDKGYKLEGEIKEFKVKKSFTYVNSTYIEPTKFEWFINIIGKPSKSRKSVKNKPLSSTDSLWSEVTDFISKSLLPKIVYYQNFLFDFPTAIYLEPFGGEGAEQEFYRKVLQDVLDALNQNLKLKEHLIDRKRSGSKNDLQNIEKVLSDMGGTMTKEVFEAWARISNKRVGNIVVTLGNDVKVDTQNRLYLEVKIKEGTDSYDIKERSLGFRWFFAFLLFTQFRKHRANEIGNMLFLLDEPASNLHQTGQQVLLSSLEQLTDCSMVIYSTHSHHLINPKWLSGAYIVINKGLNPEVKALNDDFNATRTDIIAERYYSFVASHPNEETHYKPILDILDYKPSKLEAIPNIVIPEGKTDYYIFNYFQDTILNINDANKLYFYPGAGKDKHDNIISLYLAWGRPFIVLLDADNGGQRAKQRYLNEFGHILDSKVFTLKDIDTNYTGYETEDLFEEEEKINFIQTVFPSETQYEKSKFDSAIQQNYISSTGFSFSVNTKSNINRVLGFVKDKLKSQ
ncbi:MAG: AAA family ATPase [Candidatus Shapirobacteria bacterium]